MKLAAAALLLASIGCADAAARTQTMVAIDAEPAFKALVKRIAVSAGSASGDAHEDLNFDDGVWPVRLVLAPRGGDAARGFRLEVNAYGERDKKLVGFSLASGYVSGASRYALVVIHDTCVSPASASCIDSSCNTWQPDAAQLGSSRFEPWQVSVTCEDGKHDSGRVVTLDAGMPPAMATGGQPGGATSADAGNPNPTSTMPTVPTPTMATMATMPTTPTTSPNMTGTTADVTPCDQGSMRSGNTCVDIDECLQNPCGGHGMCENLTPAFICHCDTGYRFNDMTCVDVDECATGNGGCADTCVDDQGGAHCSCTAGSWLKADGKGCAKLTAPAKLSTAQSTVQCWPDIASDAMGNALAVWSQSDGTRKTVWTDRFVAGQGWLGATKFPVGDVDAEMPRVALDAQGRGILVWIQTGSAKDLWGARYSAGSFGAPSKLETSDDGDVMAPSVAVDANGNGFVVWTYSLSSRFEVWGNRAYGNVWLGPLSLAGSPTVAAGWGRIALDDRGEGLLVWSQGDITDASPDTWNYAPYARRFDPTLQWGMPFNLDDSGQAALPDVHLAADGGGMVVWQRRQDTRVIVVAQTYDAQSGAWGQPLPLSAAGSELWPALFPAVALSASGHAAAIWSEKQGSAYRVWATDARDAAMAWSKAATVSPSDSVLEAAPRIALDPNGDGFGVWSDIGANNARNVYALRIQAQTGLEPMAVGVASDVAPAAVSPVELAFDSQGDAIMVWDTQVPTNYEVWARRFE